MNPLRPRASPLALPVLGRLLFASSNPATTTTSLCGGVRHQSTTQTSPAVAEEKRRLPKKPRSEPPAGHGERFWVFNHITANMIVYSMTPEMRKNRAFSQLPYTGKKLIPAKIRKDYWRQMAVVELGPGRGEIGRSVFQKLRELMKRHQLQWEDEALLNMTRRERGKALNDQRGNMVADLAAVLAGRGKGNKMLLSPPASAAAEAGAAEGKEVKKEGEKKEAADKDELYQATVYWANEQDKYYAESWSDNVTHVIGLPEKPKVEAVEAVEAEAEAAEGQ